MTFGNGFTMKDISRWRPNRYSPHTSDHTRSKEHQQWQQRSLKDKRYVYWWADGIYFNIRGEDDRQCILVIIGQGYFILDKRSKSL